MSKGDTKVLLRQGAFADLAIIARYYDRLTNVHAASDAIGDARSLQDVRAVIQEATGLDLVEAGGLLRALLGLHTFRLNVGLSPEESIQILCDCVEDQATAEWKEKYLSLWGKASASLLPLLDPDGPIAIHEKAVRIACAHGCLFHEASVYTDVRPVFNEAGTTVLRSVISHVLLLTYHDGSSTRQLSIALDANDVSDLSKLCDRAERKARVLKEQLEQTKWPTWVVGEGDVSNS